MDRTRLDDILRDTLHDHTLSRSEQKALGEVLAEGAPSAEDLAYLRHRAFALARAELTRPETDQVREGALIDWLEAVVGLLVADGARPAETRAQAFFSPGGDCMEALLGLLADVQRTADLCVFTITDDRLAAAIVAAQRRRVRVRIISDDDKAGDLGSDIGRFERAGILVRLDRTPVHMHHKFAVFDDTVAATGSYNWTRSADRENAENLLVTGDLRLVGAFRGEFEKLWAAYA